jgi:Protein of unknown function (DUF3592)
MRTRLPTPDVLIAEDTNGQPRVIGGLLAVAGLAAVCFAAATGAHDAWVGVAVGGFVTLVGLAVARGIGTKTLTVDRSEGLVRVRTRVVFGTTRQTFRLSDIADAVLEPQPMSDGRMFYRSAFVMHDGTHRAWALRGLGGYPTDQVAVVRAIRSFLGTAGSAAAPDGTPAIPGPMLAASGGPMIPVAGRRATLIASTLAITLCLLFIAVGGRLLWTQHFDLTAFLPVIATVQSVDVVSVRSAEGEALARPAIRYGYSVRGVPYVSDRVTPLSEARSGAWARTVAGRYRLGQRVTAYYNPRRPADAYLEREESVMPIAFVVFPLLMMGFWIALLRSAEHETPTGTFQPAAPNPTHHPRSSPTHRSYVVAG